MALLSLLDWSVWLLPLSVNLLLWAFYRGIRLIWLAYSQRKLFKTGGIPLVEQDNLITGSAIELSSKNFCKSLLNHHERLGKYVGLFYGPDPWVYTTDLDLINKVIVVDGHKNVNQLDLRMQMVSHLTGGLFQLKDGLWRRVRRSVNPLFTKMQVSSKLEVEERNESIKKLLRHIASRQIDSAGGRTFDVLHDFTALTLDLSFKKILDQSDLIKLELDKENDLVKWTDEGFAQFYNPIVYLYFLLQLTALKLPYRFTVFGNYCRTIVKIINDSLVMKKSSSTSCRQNSSERSTLSKVIDTMVPFDPEMKGLDPVNHLSFMLFASFETTSKALSIFFWLLARHPQIQEELRSAIQNEGEDALYLEWCIKEMLRLYPVAPTFGRVLADNITIGNTGKTLFKGTTLCVCPYVIHRSKEYWGLDADQFSPDRFAKPLNHRLQFIGFGAGIRGCPGQQLAVKFMKETTVQLLSKYRIEPTHTTPEQLTWTPRNFAAIILRGPINLNFIEISPLG